MTYSRPPEKKNNFFLLIQGQGRRWYIFFQKSFELVYVQIFQFNTNKKFRHVNSMVPWMAHYLAAVLVTTDR